jgi:hypothetical protein
MARSRQKAEEGGRQFEGSDGPPDRKSAVRSNEAHVGWGKLSSAPELQWVYWWGRSAN